MKTQNQIYTTLAATLLLLLFTGQASAQQSPMRASLTSSLPANDPYCGTTNVVDTPTIPAGLTPCQTIDLEDVGVGQTPEEVAARTPAANPFPAGVVDWVLVEVRDGTGPAAATVVARKPALLLETGRVVDAEAYIALNAAAPTVNNAARDACLATTRTVVGSTDPCPPVSLGSAAFLNGGSPTIAESAFLVVRHRSHLDILSQEGVPTPSNLGDYDFSVDPDKTFGGTSGIKPSTAGGNDILAMRKGDASGNGDITLSDGYDDVVRSGRIGFIGYSILDINMNNDVVLSDGYDDVVRSGNVGAVVSAVFRFPPTR